MRVYFQTKKFLELAARPYEGPRAPVGGSMAETRTKPCTFPECPGQMTFTHEEWETDPALGQLPGGPMRRSSSWKCDANDGHREEAAPEDRV